MNIAIIDNLHAHSDHGHGYNFAIYITAYLYYIAEVYVAIIFTAIDCIARIHT